MDSLQLIVDSCLDVNIRVKITANSRSFLLFAVCIAFIIFRLWNLTASCLWFDEIFSIHAATQSFSGLFSFVAQDLIHPPLFYLLLKIWITAGGESLLWLRLFPVLFSLVALIPFFLLCRELKFKFLTITVALFLAAVNGSLIKYGQEVRMYSLLLCISLFSIWLFARFLNRGKNIWILTAVNVLLVHTHYSGWLVVVAEVAAVLILQRIKIRQALKMAGIVAVACLPWAYTVWSTASAAGLAQNIGWIERPGLMAIGRFLLGLVEPFYYAASSAEPSSVYKISVPIVLLFLAAIAICLWDWKRAGANERANIKLLSLLIFVPTVLAFVTSWVMPHSIWGARHLIVVFVPFQMLGSLAITEMGRPAMRTAVLTLVILFVAYGFVIQAGRDVPNYIWCACEEMSTEFANVATDSSVPRDLFIFEDLVAYHVWFATRGKNVRVIKVKSSGVTEDPAYFLPRGFEEVVTVNAADISGENISLLFRAEKWDILGPPLSDLVSRGYTVTDRKVREAERWKAYLVQLEKPLPIQ